MASVEAHYAAHLAPIYLWMAGGMEAALAAGTADLASILPGSGRAVDLGAGFGMHSIPLARAGYEVTAIDSSALLLRTLSSHSTGLPLRVIEADLLRWRSLITPPADLILCMGDTLTHLTSLAAVEQLCEEVARGLSPNGRFLATFRDYTATPSGERRFIPVRADADRILSCFLETVSAEQIMVHDLLHERHGAQWQLTVSSYAKLRVAPEQVAASLRHNGLDAQVQSAPRGMARILATAAA